MTLQDLGVSNRTINSLKRIYFLSNRDFPDAETLKAELIEGIPVRNFGDASREELENALGLTLDFVGKTTIRRINSYDCKVLKAVESRVESPERMSEFMLGWFARNFGNPCEYSFGGDDVLDVIDPDGDYCADCCGQNIEKCWRRYFNQLRKVEKK